MKKILIAVLVVALLLCGCGKADTAKYEGLNFKGTADCGVWLSYSEINAMLSEKTEFKKELQTVVTNCAELGVSDVYIHIRAFCDSLYLSNYFPQNPLAQGYDFDVFEYIITQFHNSGIRVHGWINPYRVSNSHGDINLLLENNPARLWLTDNNPDNDKNVCFANGIYLNPAEQEVRQLVINGIREVLEKYEVDGIHFDDYFYPTTSQNFDEVSYEAYKTACKKPLNLDDWRRANVNALISGCYTAIKFFDKDIIFSISPAASIEKNYNELYADVKGWVEGGCVDFIIPQLYFGFQYPVYEYRFENLLKKWKKLMECNENVGLQIGLASYKIATPDQPDCDEWNKNDDIIAKQARLCLEDAKVRGYVLFSYSSLFSENDLNKRQRENLKGIN